MVDIGKVVVSIDPTEKIEVVTLPKSLTLKPDGVYLIILFVMFKFYFINTEDICWLEVWEDLEDLLPRG